MGRLSDLTYTMDDIMKLGQDSFDAGEVTVGGIRSTEQSKLLKKAIKHKARRCGISSKKSNTTSNGKSYCSIQSIFRGVRKYSNWFWSSINHNKRGINSCKCGVGHDCCFGFSIRTGFNLEKKTKILKIIAEQNSRLLQVKTIFNFTHIE